MTQPYNYITMKNGKPYTYSVEVVSGTNNNATFPMAVYKEDSSAQYNYLVLRPASNQFSATATPTENLRPREIVLFFSNTTVFNNYTFKLQLEQSAVATPYSPYVANPIELGENDKIWNDEGVWKLNNNEITDTNLIEQLEAIKNETLISGTNEITQTPSDLPFILNFKYYMKG